MNIYVQRRLLIWGLTEVQLTLNNIIIACSQGVLQRKWMNWLFVWRSASPAPTHCLMRAYEACPEGMQLCKMKKQRRLLKKIQDTSTLYIGLPLSPLQSGHLGTSHRSPNGHQLPCCVFLNLINCLKPLLFQRWFQFWEKSEVSGCHIWAVVGLSHLGDLLLRQKICTRHDVWIDTLSWWSCQSPVTHSCGLLSHPNGFQRGMFKLNAKFDVDSLLYLLSHFECDSHTVHMLTQWHVPAHRPVQWSHHCSHMSISVPSPSPLTAMLHRCHTTCYYINNGWTFSGQAFHIYIKF